MYFNPRTSYEVRRPGEITVTITLNISIHAPLTRCDRPKDYVYRGLRQISIHAPLTRCDPRLPIFPAGSAIFQSTHLLRGATDQYEEEKEDTDDFNPRTSYEVRHVKSRSGISQTYFNPRTSYEVRPNDIFLPKRSNLFQSTHLLRGAT